MSIRRLPWSLLRTQWLDVPIGADVGHLNLTWGAFSEVFDTCLHGLFQHVRRLVDDRSNLEVVVTTTLVENLDVLVSPLGEREKLGRLSTAADLLIAQRASAGQRQTDGCERGHRSAKISDYADDT